MLGEILGAVGSIAGSILNKKAADKANDTQREINEVNAVYTKANNRANRNAARVTNRQQLAVAKRNMAMQKEFAKSGIGWKVKDAQKAGIHPLYALGAQTLSFNPVSVGLDTAVSQAPQYQGGSAVPDYSGLADAGQNIGRAIDQGLSMAGSMESLQLGLAQAQVEGAMLDNDIKRTQLASALVTNATSVGPRMGSYSGDPFDGASGDAIRLTQPTIQRQTRRDVADPRAPHNIPGSGPSVGYIQNATGGYEPIMPPELAESYESDWIGSLGWQIRNRLLPNIINMPPPKLGRPGSGEVTRWNVDKQQWEVVKPYTGKRWFPN